MARILRTLSITGVLLALGAVPASPKPKKDDSAQLRAEYVNRLQDQMMPSGEQYTLGSLWAENSNITQLSRDYKAHNLGDTVTIQVAVQTTAQQSGNLSSQRTFQTTSGITGLAGGIPTHGLNPLLNANSDTQLKGQGQTGSNSVFQTALAATVIAVLANGNMVVEAQRMIYMNNQHENVAVRGVVRPGDIGPNNIVPSSSLGNLEIELQGKGIIADSTRPPNRLTRAVLWLLGF